MKGLIRIRTLNTNDLLILAVISILSAGCRGQSQRVAMAQVARGEAEAVETSEAGMPGITVRRLATSEWGYFAYSSISPDGRYMSRVDWSTLDLAIEDLETGAKYLLTHIERGNGKPHQEAMKSVFSRNGEKIAVGWFRQGPQLRTVDVVKDVEGKPRAVEPAVLFANPEHAPYWPFDWSPDGSQVLVKSYTSGNTNQLAVISTADGTYRALKSFDWREPLMAKFSPDGRYVAYDIFATVDSHDRDLFVLSTDGTHDARVVEGASRERLLGWHPDGSILFHSDRGGTPAVWRLPISDGRPAGPPELVKPDMWSVEPLGFVGDDFYYGVHAGSARLQSASIDLKAGRLTGAPVPVTVPTRVDPQTWDWSPDGEFLASVGSVPGERGTVIVIHPADGGEPRTIRLDLLPYRRLRWDPNGESLIVFARDSRGRDGLYRIDLASGSYRTILRADDMEHPVPPSRHFAISPDGTTLYFARVTSPTPTPSVELVSYQIEDEVYRRLTPVDLTWQGKVTVSPDGGRLLTVYWRGSRETGQRRKMIGVLSLADNRVTDLYEVSPDLVEYGLQWAPDGQSVLFVTAPLSFSSNEDVRFWSVPSAGGRAHSIELPAHTSFRSVRLSPDGTRIAVKAGEARSEVWVMTGLGDSLTIANPETSQ